MKSTHIDGAVYEKMLINGLNYLRLHEKEVNDMNVFPVPDGDTGVNMRLTLENGVKNAPKSKHFGEYIKAVVEGMLLGARGNSGVILSQIFRGICQALAKDGVVNAGEMANALINGYRTAYDSVARPVEGTILTVAREGIEKVREQINGRTSLETLFSMYLAEMKKSLSYTPEVLSVLKDAGVVDSGAMGYVYIVEGMLKYLYGEIAEADSQEAYGVETNAVEPSEKYFSADSDFTYGYCMEFLLQLMKGKNYLKHFNVDAFTEDLKSCGNSIVAIQTGDRVKVHIHTFKPARIIMLCQEYGEFVQFKLENMQLQYNEHQEKAEKKEPKELGIVCVVSGGGNVNFFKELGVDTVIEGGATMNTSAQEFVSAYRCINAKHIVVFPNNKNVIRAAEQAVSIYGKGGVTVLPTNSIAQAYFALAMDFADEEPEKRISAMKSAVAGAGNISVAIANKDYNPSDGLSCKAGDYVALKDGKLCACGRELEEVLTRAFGVAGLKDKESAVFFYGSRAEENFRKKVASVVEKEMPDTEIGEIEGGQGVYLLVIGY